MTFHADNNLDLFYQVWEPQSQANAVIILIHGYAEHIGRYDYTAKNLAENNLKVYGYDQPGHGKSPGSRALLTNLEDFVKYLHNFVLFVKRENADKKIYIIGHSMGGAIASIYATQSDVLADGVIISGAAIIPVPRLSGVLKDIADFFAKYFPELKTVKIPVKKLSKDKEEQIKYKTDLLNYTGKIKLRTAVELSKTQSIIKKHGDSITLPVLIMHGREDSLAKPEGSRLLYEKAFSNDKKIIIFERLKHELFNEIEKTHVLETVKNWIYDRL